jgi:hypothetical protein
MSSVRDNRETGENDSAQLSALSNQPKSGASAP